MLATLMYHRVIHPDWPDQRQVFAEHLRAIARTYTHVLPGEVSAASRQVCLTFDDATFDFYAYVFPLLKTLQLRAVLAIPTAYILESTQIAAAERLAFDTVTAMSTSCYRQHAPFCTWAEIREMVASGWVAPASHTHTHCNMSEPFDEDMEVRQAHDLITQHTGMAPKVFVYPYGKYSRAVHQRLMSTYPYIMRIGSAYNLGWQAPQQMIYRIDAEPFWRQQRRWHWGADMMYRLKYCANRLRGC